MAKVIAFEFLSIDGFMAGPPGHEMDFVMAGFDRDMEDDLALQYQKVGAFVMGRTTFQSLAGYWPTEASKHEPLRDYMNSMPKLVCSSSGTQAKWTNSRVLSPNVAEEIRRIRSSPGKDVMIIGSASVVQALVRLRLIDEFRFFLFPVVVGSGKPLFDQQPIQLKMLRTTQFSTGVVRVDYAHTPATV